MKVKIVLMLTITSLLFLSGQTAWAQDLSEGRVFGIGVQATFPPGPPNMFPATGLSSRLWMADLFGVEVDFWVYPGSPTFAMRTFLKLINTEMVDLYVGAGVAMFSHGGMSYMPIQGVGGLEISLSRNLALNAEIGAFGLGGVTEGVTAGLGAHFYF